MSGGTENVPSEYKLTEEEGKIALKNFPTLFEQKDKNYDLILAWNIRM